MIDLLRQDIPDTSTLDAPAVMLDYQKEWISDDSQLKVGEKSRRIGLTWAEAADDALIASSAKPAGGMNVYYIGYNQDMAIEYIEACAMWSRAFNYAASEIDEGLWDDGEDDKHIKTYTIRYPDSGHRIVALSSRPANLRGKQGVVVIDEAAFHDKLGELLKAALALLIWGGKVRVLSTHNGEQNPFNELVQEIRAGKRKGSVFHCDFMRAVGEGLYRRVCLRLGIEWTQAEEDAWVKNVYKFYGDAANEELDVVPSSGTGRYLTRPLVEAVGRKDYELLRFSQPPEFSEWPKHLRKAETLQWCEKTLLPHIEKLDPLRLSFFGEDFARSGDATILWPAQRQDNLDFHTPFVVELRNIPFEQQRQVLFYLVDRLPRFMAGALDATGNGAYLAEVAMQRYGSTRIAEVKLSTEWYRQNMPRFKTAFEDRSIQFPKHSDLVSDMLAVQMEGGVARVPASGRYRGSDGKYRHGDAAIALALMFYAVYEMQPVPLEFQATGSKRSSLDGYDPNSGGSRFGDEGFGVVRGSNNLRGF